MGKSFIGATRYVQDASTKSLTSSLTSKLEAIPTPEDATKPDTTKPDATTPTFAVATLGSVVGATAALAAVF